MQIVPSVKLKTLAECQDGSIVLHSNNNDETALAIATREKLGNWGVIRLSDKRTIIEVPSYPNRVVVAVLEGDIKIMPDASHASFTTRGGRSFPGWLFSGLGGTGIFAQQNNSILPCFFSQNAGAVVRDNLVSETVVLFPKWSIMIDKKVVFQFDATVNKHNGRANNGGAVL